MRCLTLVLIIAFGVSLPAQSPDFSGTWQLDEASSKVMATAGIVGLIPAGAPKTLHITQPANGTIVIESQINEAHVRIYKPGRDSSTPAGQGGAVAMTSKWEGRTLVSEGTLRGANGDTTAIREVFSFGPDGSLKIEVTTTARETASSTLVYTKTNGVGPCETWPTPCKRQ